MSGVGAGGWARAGWRRAGTSKSASRPLGAAPSQHPADSPMLLPALLLWLWLCRTHHVHNAYPAALPLVSCFAAMMQQAPDFGSPHPVLSLSRVLQSSCST